MSPPPLQGSLPAGWLAFTGRELIPLDRYKRFHITVSSSFSGFILAQGKFHSGQAPAHLFDHFVGKGEQFVGDFEAERPRGLAVDDKLEFHRRLYRQIARLVAPQNAIDISCCLSEQSFEFDPISGKTALLRMASERIDGWQAIACRQCNDQFNIGRDRSRWQNNQSGP